jgi:hypothetical protein
MANINNGFNNTDISSGANEGFANHPNISIDEPTTTRDSSSFYADTMNRGMESMRPVIANVRSQVAANPWLGVGVAAAACFGIGYLLGRRFAPEQSITSSYDGYVDNYSAGDGAVSSATTSPSY